MPLVIFVGLQVHYKVCASDFHRYICMPMFFKGIKSEWDLRLEVFYGRIRAKSNCAKIAPALM